MPGRFADRVDRRRLMYASNLVRFALMGALGAAVVTETASMWLLYAVALGLGSFEVLFDNAAQTIMPSVVARDQLERANGRLYAGEITTNQFVGPPLGGFLFGIAAAVPILVDAGTFLVSAGLIFWMTGNFGVSHTRAQRLSPAEEGMAPAEGDQLVTDASIAAPAADPSPPGRDRMLTDIREGVGWLWRNRLLRMLAIQLAAMNGTAMMGMAVFALYAVGDASVLGLGPLGWSLLLTAGAAGSLAASIVVDRLIHSVGRGRSLWLALLSSVTVPLTIGVTSNAWIVAGAQVVFGFTAVVWNVITVSLRQAVIPDHLLGRVNSVYRFLGWGALPVGAALGGLIASLFGLRASWLAAAVVMAIALAPAVRVITSDVIEEARQTPSPG